MTVQSGEPCPQCGHDFDLHVLVCVSAGKPMEGGWIVCPEGCDCLGTWTADDVPPEGQAEFESLFVKHDSLLHAAAGTFDTRGHRVPGCPGCEAAAEAEGKATDPSTPAARDERSGATDSTREEESR